MVRVNVTKEEKTEKKNEDSLGEYQQHPEEDAKKQDDGKKEVPLERMTKRQLLKKMKELQESVERNFDLYVRSQAEIENNKKRFQKDKEELAKYSNELLIKQLLPVMDNLEKAIAHSENKNSIDALTEGVDLTLKGLKDTLEKSGLEEIKALDEPFDPNFHQAVSEQKDNNKKSGTVLEELQKGYILNKRLIRPAMVIVSRNEN